MNLLRRQTRRQMLRHGWRKKGDERRRGGRAIISSKNPAVRQNHKRNDIVREKERGPVEQMRVG